MKKPKDSPCRKCEMDAFCDLEAIECRMFAKWAFPKFRRVADVLLESLRKEPGNARGRRCAWCGRLIQKGNFCSMKCKQAKVLLDWSGK